MAADRTREAAKCPQIGCRGLREDGTCPMGYRLSCPLRELAAARRREVDAHMREALALVDAVPQPWDQPDWTCCGDPGCPFVSKCRDTERLDTAWAMLFPPEERDANA